MTAQVSNSTAASDGPVFIVGMNGSGTTMLLDHLNDHPALYGFRTETKVLPYLLSGLSRFGDLNKDENYRRLWSSVAGDFSFWMANGREPVPMPVDWRERPRTLGHIFDDVMRYFAARDGKSRWCEKTPMHVLHMEQLRGLFPNARFVHIIRDGRDCAASFHRRWHYNPKGAIYRWKNVVAEGRRQGARLGSSYLEVIYEELTADPESGMARVCRHLGVPFGSEVLRTTRSGHRMGGNESKIIVRNSGTYRRFFSAREVAELEQVAGRRLKELGYPVENPDGDSDPSVWFRRWWELEANAVRVANVMQRKLRQGRKQPWSQPLRRIRSALQQKSVRRS